MSDAYGNNQPDNPHHNDELAKKLEQLTEERRAAHRSRVNSMIGQRGSVSDEYRLKLANTLLKNMSAREESREISDLNREEQKIDRHAEPKRVRNTDHQPAPAPTIVRAQGGAGNEAIRPGHQPDHASQVRPPSAPPRDYAELKDTHARLANPADNARTQPGTDPLKQPAEITPPILSKQQLVVMIEHFPDIRREAQIVVTQGEVNARAEVSRAQEHDRQRLERKHAAQPHPHQLQEHDLLNHQHLAERVAIEAKWIALHLKAQRSPDAAHYLKDSKDAHYTARVVHAQRHQFGSASHHSPHVTRVAQPAQDQTQAQLQQAVQAGTDLTSDQKANASPNLRQVIARKDMSRAMREVLQQFGPDAGHGPTQPGPPRGGGRSR